MNADIELNLRCPKCLHWHTSVKCAFICIGCPCDWTPPAPGSPRAEREKVERQKRMFEVDQEVFGSIC